MEHLAVFSPSDFVGSLNQTYEFAYPVVIIEGELSQFRISKDKWVYFDLKDDGATVKFFGTVYMLPGPLENGMMVQVVGSPRMHPQFGFSVNMQSIKPVGEGSIKKASDLLMKKLQAEGLFDESRKRALPYAPEKIGLITSAQSAACADFVKVLKEHWSGVEILLGDVQVQGEQSPIQIVRAIEYFNESSTAEVLVITRGGGSEDDLAAFSDERVVRAIAGSRIPTLVAIGHEVDTSLAELAADVRASTPSNAAQMVVPNIRTVQSGLGNQASELGNILNNIIGSRKLMIVSAKTDVYIKIMNEINNQRIKLNHSKKVIELLSPQAALVRGYSILRAGSKTIKSIDQVKLGDSISNIVSDGIITSEISFVEKGSKNGKASK